MTRVSVLLACIIFGSCVPVVYKTEVGSDRFEDSVLGALVGKDEAAVISGLGAPQYRLRENSEKVYFVYQRPIMRKVAVLLVIWPTFRDEISGIECWKLNLHAGRLASYKYEKLTYYCRHCANSCTEAFWSAKELETLKMENKVKMATIDRLQCGACVKKGW